MICRARQRRPILEGVYGIILIVIALASSPAEAQAADDYNVFVRALPGNQQQPVQQLYQQQPQQLHPYQQVGELRDKR